MATPSHARSLTRGPRAGYSTLAQSPSMNRTTAVFMTLAILVAHTLAIHQTPDGTFALPYDRAHVAYRLGRHLVHEGRAIWDPSGPWTDAYPSAIWILVAAAAERFSLFPTTVAQALDVTCTLAAAIVLAQFSAKRMSGLIAPLLFATSGTVAASAASGTEMPLAMLLVVVAFLAYERGYGRLLFASLALLVFTRSEGVGVLLILALFELFDRPRPEVDRRAMTKPLVLAALVLGAGIVTRGLLLDTWVSTFTRHAMGADLERVTLGAHYFGGFFVSSASAPLILLPVLFALFGRLGGTGRRALFLFIAWALIVIVNGGDALPFWNALAPVVPIAFIAIQIAITDWIDKNPRHAMVASGVIGTTVVLSLAASKLPGDLGPLPLGSVIERWMAPDEGTARAFPRQQARAGLMSELRDVSVLRSVGVFLQDKVRADARVASFWPGAVGYLSRRNTIDLLSRTTPEPGGGTTHAWNGAEKVDLIAALSQPIDYCVVTLGSADEGGFPELMGNWLERYDIEGNHPERLKELVAALRRFELVSVPVPASSAQPDVLSEVPFLLLRSRELGGTPEVDLSILDDEFHVDVRHEGHQQVVDLSVTWIDDNDKRWSLRPTGAWTTNDVDARTRLLVYDTGERSIRMLTASLPKDARRGTLSARLHSPGLPLYAIFGTAGTPASVEFAR